MGIRYVSREAVKESLDVKLTARTDAQVDRAIESASRSVEGLLHRRFYPWTGTRYFDWPDRTSPTSYRLWLDENELISVTTLVSGSDTITASEYFLRREDGRDEAPYTKVELDLADSASFTTGSTHQRNIAITGVYGYGNDTESAGSLVEALDSSETAVDISDSSLIGVGDLIKVESEYMNVTGKSMLDTGANLNTTDSLAVSNSDVSVTLGGTLTNPPQVGETILIDSERMLVVDSANSVLTVKRAYDGTVLAAHTGGSSTHIYALRTLTVERGSVGSTAAAHNTSTAISKHVVPGPVQELTLAYALNNLLQRQSGYARIAGEGESAREFSGRGIRALEKDVIRSHGRQLRMAGI
jgi:hypothetical protein